MIWLIIEDFQIRKMQKNKSFKLLAKYKAHFLPLPLKLQFIERNS